MAEQGEYGGPSFGGVGAYGEGLSEEEKEYSNAIARNILGISTNPATYGAPLDSPEAANYGFGLGSNLSSISPNLAKYASPFLNPSTGQAQFDQGFFDFSGIEGAKKANELGFGPQLAQLGLAQAIPGYTKNINFPAIMGQHLSPVAYGTKQQQQAVLKSMYDDKEISLQDAIKYGALVNHMNPNLGTLNVNPDNLNIKSYTEAVLAGLPGMSTNVTFGAGSGYTSSGVAPTGTLEAGIPPGNFTVGPNTTFDPTHIGYDNVPYNQPVGPFGIKAYDDNLFDNTPMTINVNQDLQEALGPGFSFESFNTNVDPYGQFSGENVVPLNAPKSPFGMFLSMPPPMTGPVIEMIDPVNTTPTVSPAGNAILDHIGIDQKYETPQEDIDALMDDVLGLDLPQIDQDVLGLDRAMVSTDPWGGSVTSSISHSDTEREYAERAAAERALYSQIANQITQAASQSSGRQAANAPEARPVVIPAGTQAANAPAPVRHDPIANLVRTVLSPKINQVNPAAVKAIKKGKKPDYTMMTDYQQDLVRELLNPQDSSHRAPKPTYARMDDR